MSDSDESEFLHTLSSGLHSAGEGGGVAGCVPALPGGQPHPPVLPGAARAVQPRVPG